MKIYFEYKFENGPWGGGNQFLKALYNELNNDSLITESPENADAIIFNAHQNIQEVLLLKQRFPKKLFVHRMDGLYKLYNNENDERQDLSIAINESVADLTVFQTEWALNEYTKEGFDTQRPHSIIINAPNCDLFKPPKSKFYHQKTRLVCTSWSINKNKGFNYYKYLDENLDFSKYSFTYIGNDPGIDFKNIKKIGPLSSVELSQELINHDIFITASKHECCSNSLLEAMSCGLPAIGLDSGGTPELIKEGGELFKNEEELEEKINLVSLKLFSYINSLNVKNINKIKDEYISFIKSNLK